MHSHLILSLSSVSSFRHYVEQVVSIGKRRRHGGFLPLAWNPWILGSRSLTNDEDGQLGDDEDYNIRITSSPSKTSRMGGSMAWWCRRQRVPQVVRFHALLHLLPCRWHHPREAPPPSLSSPRPSSNRHHHIRRGRARRRRKGTTEGKKGAPCHRRQTLPHSLSIVSEEGSEGWTASLSPRGTRTVVRRAHGWN